MTPPHGLHEVPAECRTLRQGHPEPCLVVIFGATGDLTRRSLIPSLYELAHRRLLPEPFAILGFARRDWSDDAFRQEMERSVRHECDFDETTWNRLAGRLHYLSGGFDAAGDMQRLADRIADLQAAYALPPNILFHLATPPSFFGPVAGHLADAGLAHHETGWRRLVVEKPFGEDRSSARCLAAELSEVFDENQIYRIDHFLGKETVQNMLVFRFANPSFEPIWNSRFVDRDLRRPPPRARHLAMVRRAVLPAIRETARP